MWNIEQCDQYTTGFWVYETHVILFILSSNSDCYILYFLFYLKTMYNILCKLHIFSKNITSSKSSVNKSLF